MLLMVLKVGALARLAGAGRHKPLQQWVTAHQGLVIAVASVALGSLTALYGTAGRWVFLEYALPQGWLVGAITFTALTPDRAPNRHWAAIARWLLWSTLPVLCLQQIGRYRLHLQRWDVLFISGWLVVLIGLELVASTPERLHDALQRLRDRDVLPESVEAGDGVERELERIAHRWSLVGGWCVPVALLVTLPWLLTYYAAYWRSWALGPRGGAELVLDVIAGSVVGGWLGRMAGYGRLGYVLAKRGLQLRVVPGHPDGAGGLRPIGAFYLYQSLTASLPAVFLTVWVLLILLRSQYRGYLNQYLWLLPLATVFEILVFVLPVLSVHASMREQRKAFLARADRLSRAIETTQARLEDTGLEGRDAVKRQLTELVERYQTLEKTPTWPMDRSIRRRITLQNLGLLLPFAGYLVGHPAFWEQVSDVLKGLG
jgi:hypothetical protein